MTEQSHEAPSPAAVDQTPADEAPVRDLTIESTSDPVIDEALERLDSVTDRPVEEHPAAFEHVHRVLRDSLSGNRTP